jgi:hypothetical protein
VSIAWNDIITAIIASIAATGSLSAFVYQYALKPRIDAQIGQDILAHYTAAGQLILTASFVFVNRGALPVAMTGLYGKVQAGEPAEFDTANPANPNLTWRQFEKVKRTSQLGEAARYASGSTGVVETLVIPGRSASPSRMVRLYTREVLELHSLQPEERNAFGAAIYTLVFQAMDGLGRCTKDSTLTCRLVLSKEDEELLRKAGREADGKINARIIFSRQPPTARKLSAGAARSAIIEFVSDGRWSPVPRPPSVVTDQHRPALPAARKSDLP